MSAKNEPRKIKPRFCLSFLQFIIYWNLLRKFKRIKLYARQWLPDRCSLSRRFFFLIMINLRMREIVKRGFW